MQDFLGPWLSQSLLREQWCFDHSRRTMCFHVHEGLLSSLNCVTLLFTSSAFPELPRWFCQPPTTSSDRLVFQDSLWGVVPVSCHFLSLIFFSRLVTGSVLDLARPWAKGYPPLSCFICTVLARWRYCYFLHLSDVATEAQSSSLSCPLSWS